ncbi:PsbP domain-containing protein 5, chloroplastic [Linum perenne]
MALLCSPNLFSSQYQQLSFSRSESRVSLNQRKCFCSASSPSSSSRPSPEMGVSRRDLMLFGLCSSLSAALPFSGGIQKARTVLISCTIVPIVSERVDFVDNLIISVTGPPNVQFIKSKDKSVWNAKDVADSVLSDKSTLVNYESRQVSDWLRVLFLMHIQPKLQVDGQPYWFYEYLVRKSPTKDVSSVQEYRHYVASTAERDGYLYSLSASTLNRQWGKMGPVLERSVSSFRLLPPTAEYVPPFKDPWRFW